MTEPTADQTTEETTAQTEFTPQVFIHGDKIYQTVSMHRMPAGKWVTFEGVPELGISPFNLVFAIPVAEVWR